jgi:hypothetical protein
MVLAVAVWEVMAWLVLATAEQTYPLTARTIADEDTRARRRPMRHCFPVEKLVGVQDSAGLGF